MNIKRFALICTIPAFCSGQAFAASSTYELTVKGKTCQESHGQLIECDYKIGKSLHISIAGLGQPDTGVSFMRSDFNGDFYATFGVLHGCVIIKPGKKNIAAGFLPTFAFISPKNGKVYEGWQECQSSY
jgi:hypothetical protein